MNRYITFGALLFLFFFIAGCNSITTGGNLFENKKELYADSIFNTMVAIISLKPFETCDPCSSKPNERGKAVELGVYDGIPSITVEGSNRSGLGNFGGPSLIEIYANKKDKKLVISTNNTTGSPYTGYDQWQDSYPIDLHNVFTYNDDKKIGFGSANNTKSAEGTTDYSINILYNKESNSAAFIVFGGGESKWEQQGSFYVKDTLALKENINRLVALSEKYKKL